MPVTLGAPRALLTALVGVGALLVGCSSGAPSVAPDSSSAPAPTSSVPSTAPTSSVSSTTAPSTTAPSPVPSSTTAAATLPKAPVAAAAGTCPYLSGDDVAQINGEKNLGVKIASAAAPADPPACFFYTYRDQQQMSTWVFRASSPAQAVAVVNRAAPVKTTDPADEPTGWAGGSKGGPGGAVYAVAKGPVAVVVTSNQGQSVKARRAAEKVIDTLGL